MLPQINDELLGTSYSYRQPSLTYRLGENVVNGKVDGLESIKQAVYCIMMTERYSNPIYDDDYGIELEQYLGADLGYINANIESTLNDALKQDDRITNIVVTDVSKIKNDECEIKFTVYTIYGSYEDNLRLNV